MNQDICKRFSISDTTTNYLLNTQTVKLVTAKWRKGQCDDLQWSRCCSHSVWLCGLYYGALHVLKSSCNLCPRVSSFLLALHCDHLALGRGSWSVCFSCICLFVRVSFCHFSLPFGVGGWLRFVIVALHGLFY